MSASAGSKSYQTYTNPVYARSFPDPFVLKHGRDYFAYCTGIHEDGNVFGVLHSRDLIDWSEIGGAMQRLGSDSPFYWAPEVTYHAGKFYLYYSVGNEVLMEIRLAVSDRPDGGFVDVGKRLTIEEFAIDPHVFIDDDGEKYLFYATDFLKHTHIGTGTVVDRMLDWDRLEGRPRPVTRAKYDWQVYDPARKEKGGVRWHTVEGPFVLKRKGRYFEMFSGGNWQNLTYGVSFASSEQLLPGGEWEQFSDGETILPILRTIPGKIVGPGHNSVVRGPNGRELYCVYHRWTEAGRVMAVDRLDFAGDRLFVCGPTDLPQHAPFRPTILKNGSGLRKDGRRNIVDPLPPSFLTEFEISGSEHIAKPGFRLTARGRQILEFGIGDENLRVVTESGELRSQLSNGRSFSARQFVGLELDGRKVSVKLSGSPVLSAQMLTDVPDTLEIFGFADEELRLCHGFEELFEGEPERLTSNGWRLEGQAHFEKNELILVGDETGSALGRVCFAGGFELAVNIKLAGSINDESEFGLRLVSDGSIPMQLLCDRLGLSLVSAASERVAPTVRLSDFMATRQLRLLNSDSECLVYLDGDLLASLPAITAEYFQIYCKQSTIALDMVRLTAI